MAAVAITVQETISDVAINVTDEGANVNIDVSTVVQDVVIDVHDVAVVLGETGKGVGIAGASVSGGKSVKDINGTVTQYNPDTDEEPAGIALNGASTGQSVEYSVSGNIVHVDGWGLTPNARYWFGANGSLISTDNNTVKSQEAGVAVTSDKLNFCPKEAVNL
jgi:hypothetical protein